MAVVATGYTSVVEAKAPRTATERVVVEMYVIRFRVRVRVRVGLWLRLGLGLGLR